MLFRKMEELKLISTETLRDLIHEKFERMPDYPKTAEEEDPLAKVCLFSFNILENLIPNPQMLPPTVSIWLIIFSPCYNIQGEFEVIKQLVGSTAGAAEAKRSEENLLSSHSHVDGCIQLLRKMDIVIDKCSPPPKGTGIQNLRSA